MDEKLIDTVFGPKSEEFNEEASTLESEIEEEAAKLFEWSQNLSFDNYYQEWDDSNLTSEPRPFGNRIQEIRSKTPSNISDTKSSQFDQLLPKLNSEYRDGKTKSPETDNEV